MRNSTPARERRITMESVIISMLLLFAIYKVATA